MRVQAYTKVMRESKMRELSSNEVEQISGGNPYNFGWRVISGTLALPAVAWYSWSNLTRGAEFPSFQYIRRNWWNG